MARRLLIVDDDRDIVEMLQKKLVGVGYDVAVAFDGEEALLKVKQHDPDVILLDLMLPKLNGFEVLQQIRENFQDKWRSVIIVSAKRDLDSLKTCYKMEADLYITKPCPIDKVLQSIASLISLIPLRIKQTE